MLRFREILQEVDEDFTDSELDDIIAEVSRLLLLVFTFSPDSSGSPVSHDSTVSPVSTDSPVSPDSHGKLAYLT